MRAITDFLRYQMNIIRQIGLICALLFVGIWLSITKPVLSINNSDNISTHQLQDTENIDVLLQQEAINLLTDQLSLNGINHMISVESTTILESSARIDVELITNDDEIGTIEEIIHVFALHDGQKIQHIFREPSLEFHQFADQISTELLPPERLQFWQNLLEEERLNLEGNDYKLPFTGGTQYGVYQNFDKHFDFVGNGWLVRAAKGGYALNGIDSFGGYYTRITHADGNYGWYVHFQANSWSTGGNGTTYNVNQGDCLALTGSTGNAYGPHLHFNVSTTSNNAPGCDIQTGCNPPNWVNVSFIEGSIPTGGAYTPYSQNSTAACGSPGCCGCGFTNLKPVTNLLPFAGLIPQGPATIAPPPTITTAPSPPPQELPTAVTNPTTSRPPDFTAPTGSLQINSGGEIVNSLNVTLRLDAQDENRVAAMRFSADSRTWTAWQPFTIQSNWQLANQPDAQTVYAQVKDEAGNISQEMMSTVTAVLSVDPPTSASYTVACSVMGMGGGTASSGSYTVNSTIGQPYATTPLQGSSYQVHPGFETACSGENVAPISHETYVPFVIRP